MDDGAGTLKRHKVHRGALTKVCSHLLPFFFEGLRLIQRNLDGAHYGEEPIKILPVPPTHTDEEGA